jgi:cellobiose phosphorylase
MSQGKRFAIKYGYFSADGREYVITDPRTPRPWINVISNGDYGLTIAQSGSGYSWRTHAQLNRLTRWEQDLLRDDWGKYIYIADEAGHRWSAGWKPVASEPAEYRCRHGFGYTAIESRNFGIRTVLTVFVPNDEPCEIWKLELKNTTRRPRRLRLTTYLEWCLGAAPDWHREFHRTFIETEFNRPAHAILARKRLWEIPTARGHWNADWNYVAFHGCSAVPQSFDTDKETFLGRYGSLREPAGAKLSTLARRSGKWLDPIASLRAEVLLQPGEEQTVCFTLGAADSRRHALQLAKHYQSVETVDQALAAVRRRWEDLLGTCAVRTPDPTLDLMVNYWLKYQAISGRLWGRTAYYQTGGAFGFRDQLQDSQVFLPIDASRTKEQILLHARHQFKDGSVYHWWHPITEIGLHNNMSDNLLWLPFVVGSYLAETGDDAILQEQIPFLDDPSQAALSDHCHRAIDRVWGRRSPRGIPLIGAGDWNDGLSAVGLDMKGESIWLGHFLHRILLDFAEIAARQGEKNRAVEYRARASMLREVLNQDGWDGAWYWRATKDTGEKLGSKVNKEGKIYLNAQTWGVIAEVADEPRSRQVMDAVEQHLEYKAGPLLLAPAYRKPDVNIGYLSRYAPGVRENGGVYTHAATWAVLAAAKVGRGEMASRLFSKINPIVRGKRPDEYYAEPYVTPGNIDGPDSPFYGRGGWTWYTGSATWLLRVGMEGLLGIRPTAAGLVVDPCIKPSWKGFSVRRKFRGALYAIEVKNPGRVPCGVSGVEIDDVPTEMNTHGRGVLLPLFPPGTEHKIVVTMTKRKH